MDPEYRKALRELILDAREITKTKKVAPHLRAAVKSHATSLAKTRKALAATKKDN